MYIRHKDLILQFYILTVSDLKMIETDREPEREINMLIKGKKFGGRGKKEMDRPMEIRRAL